MTILPGFTDTHCHLMGLGMMSERVPLRGVRSAAECIGRVKDRLRGVSTGEWLLGFGWNQEEWEDATMPQARWLDEISPDNPVVLYRIDTHAIWINSYALRTAGITPHKIEGGSILIDSEGRATGILVDNAIGLIDRVMPAPTHIQKKRWIEQGVEECLRYGITEIHDMNVEPERMEAMEEVASGGGMRLRCNIFLQAQNDEWKSVVSAPGTLAPNLHIVGVKYFADGALGSRGAYLLEPYSDMPDTSGLRLLTSEELIERAAPAIEAGFAVATHAIGDGANRLVLDAYQELRARYPHAVLRIEHAQTVHPDDQPRFAELNVIPAMQAIHCTSDAVMAEHRLGERCSYAYPWQSLLSSGVPVLGGSDFPIESADPLTGLRAFYYRRPEGYNEAWYAEQCLSQDDAIAAYTTRASRGLPAMNIDRSKDAVVLDGDPFAEGTRVVRTVVGGVTEYEAG